MIVGIDGRSLAPGRAGRGVAHYTASLAGALEVGHPQDTWRIRVSPGRASHLSAALFGRPRLDRALGGDLDVAWIPAPAPVAVSPHVPVVLTVHDLAFAQRPGDFTPYERLWHRAGRLGALARRAARVMTVSHATREAALEHWDLDPARVVVVPSGVTRPAHPPDPGAARSQFALPERYLLFVGALEPRKAPDVLGRAYARARRAGLNAGLAVVGSGRMAAALDGPGVHRLGAVERDELDALYAGALALVLPSHAEGYGFPPLEAAACGTPSVVSDLPALRETLGDGALFVAPGDEAGLAEALVRIGADEALRAELVAAAGRAVEERTWEAAARAARAVLAEAAQER